MTRTNRDSLRACDGWSARFGSRSTSTPEPAGAFRVHLITLAAERPLYSELVDTTLASDTRIRTAPRNTLL